jgi:hypothetical protein
MNRSKNIILVSIIVLFIITIIGLIFYSTKLTQKPASIVEEKPTKTESLPKIEKIRKFKIVDYDKIEDLLLSPNGQYAGIKYYKNDKVYIQINEKLYGPYEVNIWSPKYGTNASHIKLTFFNDSHYIWNFSKICKEIVLLRYYGEYFCTEWEKYYIQIDDKTYGPYDNLLSWFSLSKDFFLFDNNTKYGFGYIKEGKHYLQINDKIYGPYEEIIDVTYSPHSPNVGWLFKKDNKYYVTINEKIYGPFDDFFKGSRGAVDVRPGPRFCFDGSKYGWVFIKNNKYYIQINDKTYGPYDYIPGWFPQFSKNCSKYGFYFVKDGNIYLQINNETSGPHGYIEEGDFWRSHSRIGDVEFPEDNPKYKRWAEENGKIYLQIHNKIYGPYEDVGDPIFSKDNSIYLWWFIKDNKYYIQINDKIYGPYDMVGYLTFSDDGTKYGWEFTKDNKEYVQINDKTYGPYDEVLTMFIPAPANPIYFSNDGSKYGWMFKKDDNKYYIQINDKTYGPYDYATFTFTKDNKAYIAYISGNELVIEEVE